MQQDPKTITSEKNPRLNFQIFIPRDTKNNVNTQQKLLKVEKRRSYKVLRTQEMINAWKNSYRRVDFSWLIQKYITGDIACSKFVVNNLTGQVIEEKLVRILEKQKCAANLNLALGFILKNVDGGKFRYFHAHENNIPSKHSNFESNKDDMAKLKNNLKKTDVIESCTKARFNAKWGCFKLSNLTIFAALLRDITMGCKDAVLPESI